MPKHGLFVGNVTLDLIYLADAPPLSNQKVVAQKAAIAAGGPATNAAVAFGHLGNSATIVGAIGQHPLTDIIRSDLNDCNVQILDLDSARSEPPPVSSIVITQSTGDRAVVSLNVVNQLAIDRLPSDVLDGIDIVLIDGHQMQIGSAIAQSARDRTIPVVIDGGSWKPGFETVLPWTDYAICSANFQPPNGSFEVASSADREVIAFLETFGVSQIAITHGERPIAAFYHGQRRQIEVPQVLVVDTLGAGDFFHGAFCHHILDTDFATALTRSAQVAARSCASFGTRDWMKFQQ